MSAGAHFRTTHWSVVLRAGGSGADARTALTTLCTTYWVPLYAYARRRGRSAGDAHDLVQGFLCELLEKGWVKDAEEDRGRFRGFLVTAFRRYAGHEHAKENAQKRGGGAALLTLDVAEGESRYAREAVDGRTPEQVFARRWALTVIERAMAHVRASYARRGQERHFVALEAHLDGTSPAPPYAETAVALGMSEGAVKVAVHRMRKQFSEHLRHEVGATVDADADIDDEIRELMRSLAS